MEKLFIAFCQHKTIDPANNQEPAKTALIESSDFPLAGLWDGRGFCITGERGGCLRCQAGGKRVAVGFSRSKNVRVQLRYFVHFRSCHVGENQPQPNIREYPRLTVFSKKLF